MYTDIYRHIYIYVHIYIKRCIQIYMYDIHIKYLHMISTFIYRLPSILKIPGPLLGINLGFFEDIVLWLLVFFSSPEIVTRARLLKAKRLASKPQPTVESVVAWQALAEPQQLLVHLYGTYMGRGRKRFSISELCGLCI